MTDERTRARVGRCRGDNSGVRRAGRVGIWSIWEKHEINSGNGFPAVGERGTDDGDCGGKGGWLISLARQHIQSFTKMYVLGCEKLLLSKTGLLVHLCTESLDKIFPVVQEWYFPLRV